MQPQQSQSQKCNPTEHEYSANYNNQAMFARDEQGNAITGSGTREAALFTTIWCRKCGDTKEIQMVPRRSQRYAPEAVRQAESLVRQATAVTASSASTATAGSTR